MAYWNNTEIVPGWSVGFNHLFFNTIIYIQYMAEACT